MTTSPTEEDFPPKEEANPGDSKISKASSSTSTPWLRLKDPRIVRVSRAFGGKDRHSKVSTVRGLRDRRVRLSVPTAIQLYDLQDRLGLSQPSKVVDWLLNAAKDEIEELPPLPIPPENFSLNHQAATMFASREADAASHEGSVSENGIASNWEAPGGLSRSIFPTSDPSVRSRSKEVARNQTVYSEKENWTARLGGKQEGNNSDHQKNVLSNNKASMSGLLNSSSQYVYQWDPSNLSSSHFGSHGFITSQAEDLHNFNLMSLPSTLSLSTGSSQVLVCPPGTAQPYNPHVAASFEIDPRQGSHQLQMMLSSGSHNLMPNSFTSAFYSVSQSVRPFQFSMALPSSDNNEDQPNKSREFPPKQ